MWMGSLGFWQVRKIIKVALKPRAARDLDPRSMLCLRRTFPKKMKWPDTLILQGGMIPSSPANASITGNTSILPPPLTPIQRLVRVIIFLLTVVEILFLKKKGK